MRWLIVLFLLLATSANAVMAGFPGRMGPVNRGTFTNPTSYSGLSVWYDSSVSSSITKDGSDLVSSWANLAGATYAVTATSTARPTYYADDGDGKPTLRFSSGNYIRNTSSISMAEDTFLAVVYVDGLDTDTSRIVGHGTNLVTTSSGTLDWSISGATDGSTALRTGPPLKRGQYIVLSGRRSSAQDAYYGGTGNTGIIEIRENGAICKRTTHTAASSAGGIYVIFNAGGNTTVLRLRELIWYSRYLTDSELLTVENYLNDKWDVYDNFPGRRDYHDGLQRYFTNTGATSPSATYPLFGLAGQSNAGGRGLVADLPVSLTGPIPNAYIWNATSSTFGVLEAGVTNQSNNGTMHGPEMSFMYDYVADFGRAYLVKSYLDGTDIPTYWLPSNAKAANQWRILIDRIWTAQYTAGYQNGYHLPYYGTVWYQGEADTASSAWYNAYQANEASIVNSTRAKVVNGSNSKWISVLVNSFSYGPEYQAVNAAKEANAAAISGYFTVSKSESLLDSVHADSDAQVRIGNDAAGRFGATTRVSP